MIKTLITASVMTAASLAFVGATQAQVVVPKNQEFPATPIQKGAPTDLPGERLIPGASQIAAGLDAIIAPVVVAPVQQVGGSVGGGVGTVIAGLPIIGEPAAAPAAAAPPAKRMMMRHHSKKKMMMMKKKKMMMKKKM